MNEEQIVKRAVSLMWGSGIVGFIALIGSCVLFSYGRNGFAIIWLGIGIANTVIYAVNLSIYRQIKP